MRCIFCLWRGKPVVLEVSEETYRLLMEARERTNEATQNILAAAFNKYGKSEEAIVKYLKTDFRKEVG
jgi:hypothetical protein